ncbi:hypothetical protein GCM10022198_01930 [Klugiella xanthotipulae]
MPEEASVSSAQAFFIPLHSVMAAGSSRNSSHNDGISQPLRGTDVTDTPPRGSTGDPRGTVP